MPHSSGGSHHGGHSFHSSGSGFSRSHAHIYSRPRRYVYYRHGERCVVTTTESPKDARFAAIAFSIVFALVLVIIAPFFIKACMAPKKAESGYAAPIINDKVEILGDTSDLYAALDEFGKKTGITPAVETVYSDEYSLSLQSYAYGRYLKLFTNESSWLIVISCERSDPSNVSKWRWEGMQGNDTDNILTTSVLEPFNKSIDDGFDFPMQDNPTKVLTDAFTKLNSYVMNPFVISDTEIWAVFGFCMFGVLFGIAFAAVITSYKKYGKTIECADLNDNAKRACPKCGGESSIENHDYCPFCGYDFTKQGDNNSDSI